MTEIPYGRLHGVESALGGRPAIQSALVDGRTLAGQTIVRKFPFAFNTPGIRTGAALYTPNADDVLLDCWVEITTAWNGITPSGDVGTFLNANGLGLFAFDPFPGVTTTIDMTAFDRPYQAGESLQIGWVENDLRIANALLSGPQIAEVDGAGPGLTLIPGTPLTTPLRVLPAKFTSTAPFRVVVSQDGKKGGADPGSTQGAGVLYLATTTPA